MDRFFVVTGGPGSGKTSLIDALAAGGIRTMPEAGRAIIRDQVAIGGNALPWGNRSAFAEQMLGWEMRSWRGGVEGADVVLFDRGVPDILGYLRLNDIPAPAHILRAADLFRYNPCVFIAPPWRDIYAQDDERTQSWAEAVATCRVLAETYAELGYGLVELPCTSVEQRVAFVRARVLN